MHKGDVCYRYRQSNPLMQRSLNFKVEKGWASADMATEGWRGDGSQSINGLVVESGRCYGNVKYNYW